MPVESIENFIYMFREEHARCTASEVNSIYIAIGGQSGEYSNFILKSVNEIFNQPRVGSEIEVAISAASSAERDVDIYSKTQNLIRLLFSKKWIN